MKRALLVLAACGHPAVHTPPPVTTPDAAVASDDERTAAIEHAMTDLYPVAHQCWAVAAADDFHLAGDVSLLISVDEAGHATAEITADSTHDDVLTDCLRKVAEAYAWPPPMHGASTLLPFSFAAPDGQNVIDRQLLAEVDDGARVLLDARNSGATAASMFELTVPAGTERKATASQRDEVWIYLDDPGHTTFPEVGALEPAYLAPGTPRSPGAGTAPLHVLIVATPGSEEDATRRAGVLPESPSHLHDNNKSATKTPHGALAASIATDAKPVADHATMLYVLAGNATLTVDGVAMPLTDTSVAQIPANVAFAITDSTDLRLIRILIQR